MGPRVPWRLCWENEMRQSVCCLVSIVILHST